jgi:hypothetical protein
MVLERFGKKFEAPVLAVLVRFCTILIVQHVGTSGVTRPQAGRLLRP